MSTQIIIDPNKPQAAINATVHLFENIDSLTLETKALSEKLQKIEPNHSLQLYNGLEYVLYIRCSQERGIEIAEAMRIVGAQFLSDTRGDLTCQVHNHLSETDALYYFIEGLGLSNYHFNAYKTKKEERNVGLYLAKNPISKQDQLEIESVIKGVHYARDLVNHPNSYLSAPQLSEEIMRMAKESGFSIEVWNETKIKAQKMGGILAVNQGSQISPTFNILEWKPKGAINSRPIVLVGKGIVYDTGGMSLKPTPNSMDYMKSDMAGAATVVGSIYTAAASALPVHIIGLIPATDNRPGEEAYVPGDVITMYSGHTVEVKNTDAEGRLVLADALHYASKLDPMLVIDVATLTGAAVRAIGTYGSAVMGTAGSHYFEQLHRAAEETSERIISFPLWEEYAKELESEIADFSNLGKSEGGHMSAGKFLEKFTQYPWMHLDIAPTAFSFKKSHYTPSGGTGYGVRLLYTFLKKLPNEN